MSKVLPHRLFRSVSDVGHSGSISLAQLQQRQWHYFFDGHSRGPFSVPHITKLIESRQIGNNVNVWTDGLDEWRPASEYPFFCGIEVREVNAVARFWCRRHQRDATEHGCDRCAWLFAGNGFHHPSELAEALIGDWSAAVQQTDLNALSQWLQGRASDGELARHIRDILLDSRLDADHRVAVTLLALNLEQPLLWRGEEVTPSWLALNTVEAAGLLNSNVPAWLERLRHDRWLLDKQTQRAELWQALSASGKAIDRELADRIIFSPRVRVRREAELQRQYDSQALVVALDDLLAARERNQADSILLDACADDLLRTLEEQWQEELRHADGALRQVLADLRNGPTTRATLEQALKKLGAIGSTLERHRVELSSPGAPFLLEPTLEQLLGRCRATAEAGLQEHAKQTSLRADLLTLTRGGRIRLACRRLHEVSPAFSDIDWAEIHSAARHWKVLARLSKVLAAALASLLLLAVLQRWNASRTGEPFVVVLAPNAALRFVPVPPGVFNLGSSPREPGAERDEFPATRVRLVAPFWLSEAEVTRAQWRAVMGTDIHYQCITHGLTNNPVSGGDALPMTAVSWDEATAYCAALSEFLNRVGRGGTAQLPTEAEWEYACRAGSTTRFAWGDDVENGRANVAPSTGAVEVRSFMTNAWGLYEMHGNVSEWVRGRPATYPGGEVESWFAPEQDGVRLYRGGSWMMPAQRARSAARNGREGGLASGHVGFRVLWKPAQSSNK